MLNSQKSHQSLYILLILTLVSLVSGLAIWYSESALIFLSSEPKDWTKAVVWGLAIGILTSTIVGIIS